MWPVLNQFGKKRSRPKSVVTIKLSLWAKTIQDSNPVSDLINLGTTRYLIIPALTAPITRKWLDEVKSLANPEFLPGTQITFVACFSLKTVLFSVIRDTPLVLRHHVPLYRNKVSSPCNGYIILACLVRVCWQWLQSLPPRNYILVGAYIILACLVRVCWQWLQSLPLRNYILVGAYIILACLVRVCWPMAAISTTQELYIGWCIHNSCLSGPSVLAMAAVSTTQELYIGWCIYNSCLSGQSVLANSCSLYHSGTIYWLVHI